MKISKKHLQYIIQEEIMHVLTEHVEGIDDATTDMSALLDNPEFSAMIAGKPSPSGPYKSPFEQTLAADKAAREAAPPKQATFAGPPAEISRPWEFSKGRAQEVGAKFGLGPMADLGTPELATGVDQDRFDLDQIVADSRASIKGALKADAIDTSGWVSGEDTANSLLEAEFPGKAKLEEIIREEIQNVLLEQAVAPMNKPTDSKSKPVKPVAVTASPTPKADPFKYVKAGKDQKTYETPQDVAKHGGPIPFWASSQAEQKDKHGKNAKERGLWRKEYLAFKKNPDLWKKGLPAKDRVWTASKETEGQFDYGETPGGPSDDSPKRARRQMPSRTPEDDSPKRARRQMPSRQPELPRREDFPAAEAEFDPEAKTPASGPYVNIKGEPGQEVGGGLYSGLPMRRGAKAKEKKSAQGEKTAPLWRGKSGEKWESNMGPVLSPAEALRQNKIPPFMNTQAGGEIPKYKRHVAIWQKKQAEGIKLHPFEAEALPRFIGLIKQADDWTKEYNRLKDNPGRLRRRRRQPKRFRRLSRK